VLVRHEAGLYRTRMLAEEGDCLVVDERRDPVLLLAAQPQRRPTRRQHLDLWRLAEKRCDAWRGGEQVFEVVEQQERVLRTEVVIEPVLGAHRLSDRGLDKIGICERGE
jgi:hypothetical protein